MAITFGLDISHHQPLSLNLAAARRDGCEFAFLKATEGSNYTDPLFDDNLAEARGAGMFAAAYVYQRANATAKAHVDLIKTVVPRDVPVIPDVEANSGSVALTRQIIDQLRAAGYRVPLLYLPRWYWQQLGSPSLAGLPPLWSSRYPNNVVGLLASEWAEVPASYWNGYGGLDVAVLQFTSNARIAGHSPLDANAFRGSRAELAALLNGSPAQVAPRASTNLNNDEENTVLVPAGNNDHVVIPAAGRPRYLYIFSAYGDEVQAHNIDFVLPTKEGTPDGDFVPGAGLKDWTFHANRPGPVEIPACAGVILRYTATHSFTAYVG